MSINRLISNSIMKIAAETGVGPDQTGQQNVQQAADVQINNQSTAMQPQQQAMASPQDMMMEALGMINQGTNIIAQLMQQMGMPLMMPQQGGMQVPQVSPPQPMVQTPPQAFAQAPALTQPAVQSPMQQQKTI